MATARRTCAAPDCAVKFIPQRATAKYHSTACRKRAGRARTGPAAQEPSPAKKKARPARKTAPVKKAAAKRPPAKRTPAAKKTAPAKKATPAAATAVDIDGLVESVQHELERAEAVGTFAGQLALQLAKRLTDPEESGISSLSKELRTVMVAALQGATPPAATDEEAEDEVERARRRREEARQAAGLS